MQRPAPFAPNHVFTFSLRSLVAGLSLLALAGCQTPQATSVSKPMSQAERKAEAKPTAYVDIERVEKRDDIVRIVQFWGQDPWIYDSVGRVIGFKVPTYFVSSETEKGAFVTGRVFVWLHVVQRSQAGELVRRTVHMWQMNESEAFLFASRRPAIGGFFYGFILTWPRSIDLSGQTLEIEFAYERGDGRLVMSSGRTFRVPLDPREAFTTPMIRPKRPGTPPADDAPFDPPPSRMLPPAEQAPPGQPEPSPAPQGGDVASEGRGKLSPAMQAVLDAKLREAERLIAERRAREQAEQQGQARSRPVDQPERP